MASDDRRIQGGGGITRGPGARSDAPQGADPLEMMRAFRRRWASGVAVLTINEGEGYRGITLTAVMPLSLEPPLVATAVTADGAFAISLAEGRACGLSILDRSQIFLSERFAGRAPLPDPAFTGIPFDIASNGVPVLRDAPATAACRIASLTPAGDHVLATLEVIDGRIGPDEDDPLISYEGGYRGLEVE